MPEYEVIAVKTLIEDVIQSMPPIDSMHITTDVEDLRVEADPHLMHRVFANLFLNAMQAMPDGGTLTVSAAVQDGSVAISVRDTVLASAQNSKISSLNRSLPVRRRERDSVWQLSSGSWKRTRGKDPFRVRLEKGQPLSETAHH